MQHDWFRSTRFLLRSGAFVPLTALLLMLPHPVCAQLIPDATLGSERSRITPNVPVRGSNGDRIDGGAIRGANLFHSFTEFNVGDGQRVYFSNPAGVENILSRVTGTDVSDILGTLGVDGGANLFLLNPNGIIFGPNAQLDVNGSFVASTGDRFTFPDGGEFSATNPQMAPLLTVNVPIGLQPGTGAGAIANRGNLAVGQDLTLSGGFLDLEGHLQAGQNLTLQAHDTLQIRDRPGQPFVALAGDRLLLQGNQQIDIAALSHPDSRLVSGGDMVLRGGAGSLPDRISGDAHYWSGGAFRVEQLNGTLGNWISLDDPVIRASGDVSFGSYTGASLHILAGGSVTIPGIVQITGADTSANSLRETITLSNGTPLTVDGSAQPTLDIRAGTTAFQPPGIIGNASGFLPPGAPTTGGTGTGATITIGGIFLSAPGGLVFLSSNYAPNPSYLDRTIRIDGIDLSNLGLPGLRIGVIGTGNAIVMDSGGDIAINGLMSTSAPTRAGDITLLADGNLTTGDIFSVGDLGGSIALVSDGAISLSDRLIITASTRGVPNQPGGNIRLQGRSVLLDNGARVISATNGRSDGGDIAIAASEFVESRRRSGRGRREISTISGFLAGPTGLSGLNLSVDFLLRATSGFYTATTGAGSGGNITINTQHFRNQDLAQVRTFTLNRGNGGNIHINASESIELVDGDVSSQRLAGGLFTGNGGELANTETIGNSGSIRLDTERLTVRGGQVISSATTTQGQGGQIVINAAEQVEVSGLSSSQTQIPSMIASATRSSGQGGNLTIRTGDFVIREGGFVSSGTTGRGNGGELNIHASRSVQIIGDQIDSILATDTFNTTDNPTGAGRAGDLTITTPRLLVRGNGIISASSFSDGSGGNLSIHAIDAIQIDAGTPNGFPTGIYAQGFSRGNSGNLEIRTHQLTLQNGATITTASDLPSDAFRRIPERVGLGTLANFIIPDEAVGDAGRMVITAASVRLENQSSIRATTLSSVGGDIQLNVQNLIQLGGNSEISASTQGGEGGDITISAGNGNATQRINLSDRSRITAAAEGTGSAGNIRIAANILTIQDNSQTPNTQRAGIFASNLADAGDATRNPRGSITLRDLNRLDISNGEISTSTTSGQAGDVTIRTQTGGDLTLRDRSRVASQATAGGDAGNLSIGNVDQLHLDRSRITVSSTQRGQAGNLSLAAQDVRLDDRSEITAETVAGQGGNLSLWGTNSLMLDNSEITVSSPEGQAGFLSITTRDLRLSNGRLTAETGFSPVDGEGANIQLRNLNQLLMEDGSLISARAFGNANGGNIAIDASRGFVIAIPDTNNDIIATAKQGTGGTIEIQSNRIFGFVDQTDGRLSFHQLRNNTTSDINASSEFGTAGQISLSTLEVDPGQGLVELPTNITDDFRLVAQTFAPGTGSTLSEFVVTGRGGLFLSPLEPRRVEAIATEWVTLPDGEQHPQSANRVSRELQTERSPSDAVPIVEAQGWVLAEDSNIVLTAQPPSVSFQPPAFMTRMLPCPS